ncbi:MAG: 3-deoxy-7-phosphoheptulonate synthase [Chlamydiae bacterium]|nr:3-deoxy-7-phosphoheptulonate synthase [Chlamydiota bacterium]
MILECVDKDAQYQIANRLKRMGFDTTFHGTNGVAVIYGLDDLVREDLFHVLPGVKRVIPIKEKQKLASRKSVGRRTVIEIQGRKVGGNSDPFIIAGPCSIESEEQIFSSAKIAKENGAHALRGGAFKPRTSPYEFQGMGLKGLEMLSKVGKEFDLLTVTEVLDLESIHLAAPLIDILQVGARNMQNFELLKQLGKVKNPILLKRGFAASYQDLLYAAEYLIAHGNPNVILCERGIRTFETYTRNTLDLNAVPSLQELTHLPILIDPSHGTGRRSLVLPMARAGIAAGADGIIVEIHPNPDQALTDAQQTIGPEVFRRLMKEVLAIHQAFIKE